MLAEILRMETTSTYYTRRAREERANAVEAASAEARTAHLEMAFRLVKAATQPSIWSQWYRPLSGVPRGHNDNAVTEMSAALRDAFPVQSADDFQQLLDAVDRTTGRS